MIKLHIKDNLMADEGYLLSNVNDPKSRSEIIPREQDKEIRP